MWKVLLCSFESSKYLLSSYVLKVDNANHHSMFFFPVYYEWARATNIFRHWCLCWLTGKLQLLRGVQKSHAPTCMSCVHPDPPPPPPQHTHSHTCMHAKLNVHTSIHTEQLSIHIYDQRHLSFFLFLGGGGYSIAFHNIKFNLCPSIKNCVCKCACVCLCVHTKHSLVSVLIMNLLLFSDIWYRCNQVIWQPPVQRCIAVDIHCKKELLLMIALLIICTENNKRTCDNICAIISFLHAIKSYNVPTELFIYVPSTVSCFDKILLSSIHKYKHINHC